MGKTLLKINDLYVEYSNSKINGTKIIKAVNGISMEIKEGEIYSIAGESGCGKSTLGKAIMNLLPIKKGIIEYDGENIFQYSKEKMKNFKKNVQMIFQNPYSSLNPKMKIKEILKEPLETNTDFSKKEINNKVEEIIEKVGLKKEHLEYYPHEFSGGQRQRIAIARALILEPKLIIADEPVSALDTSIQAQILNLLNTLKEEYNLTILFISHDLSVIKYLSDRVGIMYLGEILEEGTKEEIYSNPTHPYTKALLNAIPKYNKENVELLEGEIPAVIPNGCKFYSRCKISTKECEQNKPDIAKLTETHSVRCNKGN